jgi:hypothetical protein
MRKLHLLFLFSGLICFTCTSQSKTQEKTDFKTIKADRFGAENDSQEKETVRKVSTSFYDWYLKQASSSE